MKVHTRFLLSALDERQFPAASVPEIAFLGRSNVGKSSLINALAAVKIAKTSNTPGRTQAINFFEVRWPGHPKPDLLFVDLPGYGYARVPREITNRWQGFVDPYLAHRPTLALCLCLVDANVPPQKNDAQLIEFLQHVDRPLLVVATKADKVGSRLHSALEKMRQGLGVDKILPFSSKTGMGKDELWKLIRMAVERSDEESGGLAGAPRATG
ncbi:MAG: ribosome biogenesis GTP-binding protein YihA/YsxC [Candidatus Korobacteraceae bacterium]|jgi:GTP-binding protein